MLNFNTLLDTLEKRPGMLIGRDLSYESAVAYLLGVDHGTSGGFLSGFQELVELKCGSIGSPLGWPRLLLSIEPVLDEGVTDDERLARLFEVLREYMAVDFQGRHRKRRLWHEWVTMAQEGEYYDTDMIRYGSSPADEHVSLTEAAAMLEVTTEEVLSLIADGQLTAARTGPDPVVSLASVASHLQGT